MTETTRQKQRKKYQISFNPNLDHTRSRTKQSFRQESNINNIMAKYEKTGLIEHYNKYQGDYGDFTTTPNYQEALNSIMLAENMFNELPATIRKRFNNQPEEFIEFTQNPDNHAEMVELGLATAERVATPPENPEATSAPADKPETTTTTSTE